VAKRSPFPMTVNRAGVLPPKFSSLTKMFVLMVLTAASSASALPPNAPQTKGSGTELRNFHHTAWSSDSALGAVFDIQQSADGYLWLTTSRGIFRFDGVRFQSADEITAGATKNLEFASAFVSSSGDVWFRTRLPGLLLWRDGKLSAFPIKGCTPGLLTGSMVEDRDGRIWVAGSAGLFNVGEGKCEQVSNKYGLPGGFPSAITVDTAGTLWVKMPSGKLLYLPRGDPKFKPSPYGDGPVGDFAYLHAGPDGSVWLSDERGLRRVSGNDISSRPKPRSAPALSRQSRFGNFTFDRSGTVWAASVNGIQRITNAGEMPIDVSVDPAEGQNFTLAEGLSSDVVWKLFVDREGSLWVGTNSGLDQLRRNVISQLEIPATNEHQFAIAAGENHNLWIGSRTLPLTLVNSDGVSKTFPETRQSISIRRDFKGGVWSTGLGKNNLWRAFPDRLEPVHYPHDDVEVGASATIDKNGNIWILTFGQNVYRQTGADWQNENKALGRESGVLGSMETDEAGNVWFAFSNHVIEWDGSAYRRYTYTGKNRFPTCLAVKGNHAWLGAEDGVQLLTQGQFHMMRWQDANLPGRVTGMVETEAGDLWVSGFSGIAHVKADELRKWLKDPDYAVSAEGFNTLDGLPGLAAERYPEPSVVEADDGRLWFATIKGIAWLDPAALDKAYNSTPPTVIIDSLVSNGKEHSDLRNLVLPPRTGRIQIDYAALSLAIPERVRFRYKLEGADSDWQDAGTRREAFYTNLRPGHYRFRVIACNYDGVWNNEGADVQFTIDAAWYQTLWFYALCAASVFIITWALYQLRLRQVARAMSARFDERLSERTRIARDLHDTFLQTIQGSKLVADSALRQAPDPARMRGALEQLSVWLGRATEEGRAALNSLRTSTTEKNDLAAAFERAIEECRIGTSMEASFSVVGEVSEMHPIVRDEVYRIGYEATRNACTHSEATQLQVELTYAEDLVLRIRDNGVGIDPAIVNGGKAGHFGLQGMRERADRIMAKLTVDTSTAAGTEVKLVVPGSIIYRSTISGRKI
jgi:signal transduction histidine kinase/ligand-binding sensor domain-containing protein